MFFAILNPSEKGRRGKPVATIEKVVLVMDPGEKEPARHGRRRRRRRVGNYLAAAENPSSSKSISSKKGFSLPGGRKILSSSPWGGKGTVRALKKPPEEGNSSQCACRTKRKGRHFPSQLAWLEGELLLIAKVSGGKKGGRQASQAHRRRSQAEKRKNRNAAYGADVREKKEEGPQAIAAETRVVSRRRRGSSTVTSFHRGESNREKAPPHVQRGLHLFGGEGVDLLI